MIKALILSEKCKIHTSDLRAELKNTKADMETMESADLQLQSGVLTALPQQPMDQVSKVSEE